MYARYIPPPKAKGPGAITPARLPAGPHASAYAAVSSVASVPQEEPPNTSKKIVFGDDEVATASILVSKKRKLDGDDQTPASHGDKHVKKSKRRAGGGDTEMLVRGGETKAKAIPSDVGGGPRGDSRKSRPEKEQHHRPTAGNEDPDLGAPFPTTSFSSPSEEKVAADAPQSFGDQEAESAERASEGRRHKEKKKRGDTSDATRLGNADTDGVSERHKAVLMKKERSLRASANGPEAEGGQRGHATARSDAAVTAQETEELHGLEPLPQPEPIASDSSKPTYETLPQWLASPVRVSPETKAPFVNLGVSRATAKVLEAKGYKEGFAVQTAVIPLLMPSADRQGDLIISAATGSGKTLAYVLPMVNDISQNVATRLRGLIVVPTRELVRQAQEVCEACVQALSGSGRKRVRVGISMGSQAFKQEQTTLMDEEQRYDPESHTALLKKQANLDDPDDLEGSSDDDMFMDTSRPLPGHAVESVSKVDILICTPGRLVEHINLTPGFTLDYVRWLVVDEADRLLAQSFQQWLETVMDRLRTERPGARVFPSSNKSGVRKVVLSATMTRDLSLLGSLKLHRPKLIVLEGTRPHGDGEERMTNHALPELLKESAIKVRDPNLKPLYLVQLLCSGHMSAGEPGSGTDGSSRTDRNATEAGSDSDSSSLSSSESGSSDSEDSDGRSSSQSPFCTTALVFTKSNETALRLSRLISLLAPHLSGVVGTLTSTTRTSQRRKTLRAFASRKVRILVASDLVSRGLDLPKLDHVINYDMPTSVASYVHRVGRTARAGSAGHAWTLFTKPEAGWFWPAIGGHGKSSSGDGVAIERPGKVRIVRLEGDAGGGMFTEETVTHYEAALEELGREARELRQRN